MTNSSKAASDWYKMFKAQDSSNRGFIYASEFRQKIEQMDGNYGLSPAHRTAICNFCDQDSNKKIDFEELCFMVSFRIQINN